MLSILLKFKKERTIEQEISEIQQGNTDLQNRIIHDYKPFIAKTVSSVCKRFINEGDDEFSIGLIAFNEAIEKYSIDKGSSFIAFAELLIKRRVIDYIRKEAKLRTVHIEEEEEKDTAQTYLDTKLSMEEFYKKIEQEQRREEIIHYQKVLKEFGISFQELVEQSPKHFDARLNAIKVAKLLAENRELCTKLFEKKQLPIKQLQSMVHLSRKTLERNRKYIIAITIVLTGDYVYLKDYIKGVLQ
ncbi:RNA polymerase sigma factor [Anoxybacillus vitaminiphilus]|uniref:RNA polymerase sigma factor SigI n=2 Tax=Paranoxybacillus vitaminiphilus TaxID=581036 RepID=A0A327YRC1_9BACL|nr:RNA polymerase sigma factor [Anoxybacillus vitaminiphilus]